MQAKGTGGYWGWRVRFASVRKWVNARWENEAVVHLRVFSLPSRCDPLCFGRIQTHHNLTVIVHMPGMHYWGWQAEDTVYETKRARRRKAKLFFVHFSEFRDETLMQKDNVCLSQRCSNTSCFPKWICAFWLSNVAAATVGEAWNSLGLVAHRPVWCCVGLSVMGQIGPSCGTKTINTLLWSALLQLPT